MKTLPQISKLCTIEKYISFLSGTVYLTNFLFWVLDQTSPASFHWEANEHECRNSLFYD